MKISSFLALVHMILLAVVSDLQSMEKRTLSETSGKSCIINVLPIGTQITLPNRETVTLTQPCSLENLIDIFSNNKARKNSDYRQDTCGISNLLYAVKETRGLYGEEATKALENIKRLVEEEKYNPVMDEDPYVFQNLLFWTDCCEVLIYLVEKGVSLIKPNKYSKTVTEVAFNEKNMRKFEVLLKCLHDEINKNDHRKKDLVIEMNRLQRMK